MTPSVSKYEDNGWNRSFRGKIKCHVCLESKSGDKVRQVKDGRGFKYVCGSCNQEEVNK